MLDFSRLKKYSIPEEVLFITLRNREIPSGDLVIKYTELHSFNFLVFLIPKEGSFYIYGVNGNPLEILNAKVEIIYDFNEETLQLDEKSCAHSLNPIFKHHMKICTTLCKTKLRS